jgi:hypothetical protein
MSPATPDSPCVAPEPISALLSELLGQAVSVAPSDRSVDARAVGYVATYRAEDGSVHASILCDMTLAVTLAACLTLLAQSSDAAGARTHGSSPPLFDRLREVFSSATQLLVEDACLHVSLQAVYLLPGDLPEAARKAVFQPSAQCDFEVEVPSYGKGLLSFRFA